MKNHDNDKGGVKEQEHLYNHSKITSKFLYITPQFVRIDLQDWSVIDLNLSDTQISTSRKSVILLNYSTILHGL